MPGEITEAQDLCFGNTADGIVHDVRSQFWTPVEVLANCLNMAVGKLWVIHDDQMFNCHGMIEGDIELLSC